MKLRNKKTGDIVPASNVAVGIGKDGKWYDSLAELNAEWEDAPEEPKTYYYVSDFGAIREGDIGKYPEDEEDRKRIGNYFGTREEAEKAIEKLKAWERLKDKGFRFKGYTNDSGDLFSCQVVRCDFNDFGRESSEDLRLLFSGDEE